VKKLVEIKKSSNITQEEFQDLLSIMINACNESGNQFNNEKLISESLVR